MGAGPALRTSLAGLAEILATLPKGNQAQGVKVEMVFPGEKTMR